MDRKDLANIYTIQAKQLLPRGWAWTRSIAAVMHDLCAVVGSESANIHARILALLEESDPKTTQEMLSEWESVFGLPDPCLESDGTVQERRADLLATLRGITGLTLGFFHQLARDLGFDIKIEEYRPFVCGYSRCGDRLNGPHRSRYLWRVTVVDRRIVRFRCGISRCGEPLGFMRRAQSLECRIKRYLPAHTRVVFKYLEFV